MIRRSIVIATLILAAFVLGIGAAPDALQTRLDLKAMDKAVDPGDDFFAYANGAWVKRTEIPSDRAAYGGFSVLEDEVNRRTADLIREARRAWPRGRPSPPAASPS